MLGIALCKACHRTAVSPVLSARQFTTSPVLQSVKKDRLKSAIRVKSKKAIAAKAKRKADIIAKELGKAEKLPLMEAIKVLRSCEVASPDSMYCLYVKTELGNGVAVPKGRFKLPREAKAQSEDKILVFAEGKLADDAKRAGAHIVGGTELIDSIVGNKIRATTYISTFAFIKQITPRLGRFLGPQGLMPSERRGTVTDDVKTYIEKLKGTNEWKADKVGNIHMPIAQINFPVHDVEKNFRHFMESVKEATGNVKKTGGRNEKQVKVAPISKVLLTSRQGPGIRISDY